MQLESLIEEVEITSGQCAAAKAACTELEQRRQQLLDDNAACESAIGDVFNRKEASSLFMRMSLLPATQVALCSDF